MTTLAKLLHLDDGEFPAARAQIEAQPLPQRKPFRAAYTGVAADVLPWLHRQDRDAARDPFRYDPNRLLPSSARVRRVCVDSVPMEAPQPVAQLCAAAGLVYAKRHVAAELAPVVALLGGAK